MVTEINTDHRLSTRLDADTLHSIPRDKMAADALLLMDGLRNHSGEEQMAATAVLFAVFCRRFNQSPQDLYEMGKRIINTEEAFHDKGNQLVETLKDFSNGHLSSNPSF